MTAPGHDRVEPSVSWGRARVRAETVKAFVNVHLRRFRSRRHLEAWQERRVRRLLAWVRPRSPWLDARFGGRPSNAWRELVPSDKARMMANFDDLVTVRVTRDAAMQVALRADVDRDASPSIDGLTVGLSSGTSGSRGLFLVSPREQAAFAGTILARMLVRPFSRHRIAFFLRANSRLYQAVGSRTIDFRFFDLSAPLDRQVDEVERYDPTILVAPPSMLRFLADATTGPRSPHRRLRPLRTISVAEVLDPVDERAIAQAFGGPVHQIYQATEGTFAATCAYGTLHVLEDLVHVEPRWLDEHRTRYVPIVTDLWRTVQPTVRHLLDDVWVPATKACPCGSPFAALDAVEGRKDDVFHLAGRGGGTVAVFPDFLRRAVLTASDQVTEYRIVQRASDRIDVGVDTHAGAIDAPIVDDVVTALERVWQRFGVVPPTVRVHAYRAVPGPKKIKRVAVEWDRR